MLPEPELLKQLISYDPETGALTWKERPIEMFKDSSPMFACRWNSRFAGKPALAAFDANKYLRGRIFGFDVKAHRAAWAVHFGAWPSGDIDHINGNPSDNRLCNLRDVPHSVNAKNKKLYTKNSSGQPGVYWDKTRNRWRVEIWGEGKKHSLGQFDDLNKAISARKASEERFKYHANNGRVQGFDAAIEAGMYRLESIQEGIL